MLTENVLTALQLQLNHEITNYYTYKNFSGIADFQGLTGACKWFNKQADEEKSHFDKLYTYISDKGHIPQLLPIPDQPLEILTLDMLFAKAVELESYTTKNFKLLAELCKIEQDDQTYQLVLCYLNEQIEEEKIVGDMFRRSVMSMSNHLIIDQELGALK